ncbi:MAG: ATP-dependent Clp protease adapter ClpS [Georgenia sp.]
MGTVTPTAPWHLRVATAPAEQEATGAADQVVPERPWRTSVWNDPVNLMSYVTYVFQTYFGYDEPTATRLMMRVHTEGRAIVSHGSREKMEADVQAMHAYGLWATLEQEEA